MTLNPTAHVGEAARGSTGGGSGPAGVVEGTPVIEGTPGARFVPFDFGPRTIPRPSGEGPMILRQSNGRAPGPSPGILEPSSHAKG
jgi:hypothetical protein